MSWKKKSEKKKGGRSPLETSPTAPPFPSLFGRARPSFPTPAQQTSAARPLLPFSPWRSGPTCQRALFLFYVVSKPVSSTESSPILFWTGFASPVPL